MEPKIYIITIDVSSRSLFTENNGAVVSVNCVTVQGVGRGLVANIGRGGGRVT